MLPVYFMARGGFPCTTCRVRNGCRVCNVFNMLTLYMDPIVPKRLLMFNNLIVGPFQQEKADINPPVYKLKRAYVESEMAKIQYCNLLTNDDKFMKF